MSRCLMYNSCFKVTGPRRNSLAATPFAEEKQKLKSGNRSLQKVSQEFTPESESGIRGRAPASRKILISMMEWAVQPALLQLNWQCTRCHPMDDGTEAALAATGPGNVR